MSWLWWVLIVVVGLVLAYFVVGGVAAITMTKVGEHPQYDKTPESFGVDYHSVVIYSRKDRLKLSAWYLPNGNPERCVLLVHGRNASKQNAISGKLPELAAKLTREGYAVLMIDMRGHGESQGKRYTWGEHERRDVLGGVDFLLEEGFEPGKIAVLGISLGGAAAAGAAAEDKAIGALILDSTFAELIQLVEPNWVNESQLPMFFLGGAYVMWQIFYGFDLKKVKPVEDIKKVPPRPILIMHSCSDEMIEVSHAHQMAEAVPSAKLVIFDDCDHAELYRDAPEKYLDTVIPFLRNEWGAR
jgi:pimeloyl-ACP methyl ester carboxylesterase